MQSPIVKLVKVYSCIGGGLESVKAKIKHYSQKIFSITLWSIKSLIAHGLLTQRSIIIAHDYSQKYKFLLAYQINFNELARKVRN